MSRNKRVWLFDLDDTLHDASSNIFPIMNQAMTQYIQEHLTLTEPEANQLRQHYWRVYGATLKGLVRHHNVNPHHFLSQTHQLFSLPEMVVQIKQLRHLLQQLHGQKVIFTNAPKSYAFRVLDLLGIGDIFQLVFSVESSQFHAKPSVRGFQTLLKSINTKPSHCIMVEDSLPALMTAKRLGMKTIWINQKPQKPVFVDYRLRSVLALTHLNL